MFQCYGYLERVAERRLGTAVSASNPRSSGCSSWVEKLLFFLVCLEVCKPVSPQEHIMEEHADCTSGVCPGASENGETVSLYVDYNHPLIQLSAPCRGRRSSRS